MTGDMLFRLWPYAALSLLGGGLCVRALLLGDRMPATRRALTDAMSSFLGGRLSQLCLLVLGAGHLAALVAPRAMLAWNAAPWRLHLLEAVGIALGAAALAAWVRAAWRHLSRRNGSVLLDLGDAVFLAFLVVAISTGLLTALLYRWGSSWSVATLTPWALSLLTGHPTVGLVDHLPLFVRLHLVSGLGAAAIFPFTRLGPLPLVLARSVLDVAARPVAQAARAADKWARRSIAARLWPEPEVRWLGQPANAEPGRGGDSAAARRHAVAREQELLLRQSGSKT